MDVSATAGVADRHHDARCASIALGDSVSNARFRAHCALLRKSRSQSLFNGMLGWCDLRCVDAILKGVSVGALSRFTRSDAQPAPADVAAFGERGGLYELSG